MTAILKLALELCLQFYTALTSKWVLRNGISMQGRDEHGELSGALS